MRFMGLLPILSADGLAGGMFFIKVITHFNIKKEKDMFGLGFTEILVILVLVLILFGAGKLPSVMGDLGKGLKSFKDEMDGKAKELDKPAKVVVAKVSAKKPASKVVKTAAKKKSATKK